MSKTTLKSWCLTQAERCGVNYACIWNRINRGSYDGLIRVTHKNQRVAFVEELKPVPVIPRQQGGSIAGKIRALEHTKDLLK